MKIEVNWQGGYIRSLVLGGKERQVGKQPLFTLSLRDGEGNAFETDAQDGRFEDGRYVGIPHVESVTVMLEQKNEDFCWRIAVVPHDGWAVEWVDFPSVSLPDLIKQDPKRGGRMLYPYNEGAIVESRLRRDLSMFRSENPSYPSHGSMPVFPNMIGSQMMGYLWEDCGLYMGAHDPARAVKGIDFVGNGRGITVRMRLFSGCDIGQTFATDYDIVWRETDGRWESMGDVYRAWFEKNLPPRAKKVTENPDLPEWYHDLPLVVAYPVRGKHDMDKMDPNAFYPYTKALPMLDHIKSRTGARLMALLMHWEGTAPWAPPYVWPPYGDAANFEEFKQKLHAQNDLLGVYCSGFGYTLQSNLDDYHCEEDYQKRGLEKAMCAGPDQKVAISRICTGQRRGYDICPASPLGRSVLNEAYRPLLESGIDYSQILDQNHGGSQYFCYSRHHGHPYIPGKWMTQQMQKLLGEWNEIGKAMLLGCESAAAEPFIGNLQMSDNRFELNYHIGRPVPLYAYIYHEYLHNFMGNQVACNLPPETDTLAYRMAYSFSIGDCMTLVVSPDGRFLTRWGYKGEDDTVDRDQILTLVANLTKFYYEQAQPYLHAGRMTAALPLTCDSVTYGICTLPSVHVSAWEKGDERVHILVNPLPEDQTVVLGGQTVTVPALDAILVE